MSRLLKMSELKFPNTFIGGPRCSYEGYWRDCKKESSILPFPVPHSSSNLSLDRFLIKLERVEAVCSRESTGIKNAVCCLCECDNDMFEEYVMETQTREVRWPVGLLHYYREHHIHPSKEFYCIIMTCSTKKLPRPSLIDLKRRDLDRCRSRDEKTEHRF